MKKTSVSLVALVMIALLAAFSSCNNDKNEGSIQYYGYATLHSEDPNNFWFEADSSLQLLPNHNSDYSSFKVSQSDNGSRAIVYFKNLAQGTLANARTMDLLGLRVILTKNAFSATTKAQLDSVGDDAIYTNQMHLTTDGKYLDTYLSVPAVSGDNVTYEVSLIENTLANHQPDYVNLEVRLNRTGTGTSTGSRVNDYVSFRLPDSLNPVKNKLKGLYVRVKGENQINYLRVTPTTTTVDRSETVTD